MGRFDEWFADDASLMRKGTEHDSTQEKRQRRLKRMKEAQRKMGRSVQGHSVFWKNTPPPKLIAMIIGLIILVALLRK